VYAIKNARTTVKNAKQSKNCKNLNSLLRIIQMRKTGTYFKYYSVREFRIRNDQIIINPFFDLEIGAIFVEKPLF